MNHSLNLSRRDFLNRAGGGFGSLALASLLQGEGLLAADAPANPRLHHPAKAKTVIWLFMNGGPSGIDLFDHKPALDKLDGQQFPGKIQTLFPHPGPIMRSPFKFKRYGESGQTVSEICPHIAKHVDDITFLKACRSEANNHAPACHMVNAGVSQPGSPNIGAWVNYGLGTRNKELPGFVVMYDPRSAPEGGANLWDSAYLPGENQGVPIRPTDNPILYLNRSKKISQESQQSQLELLTKLNHWHLERNAGEMELQTRIQSFETAYKMQMSAPDIIDTSNESRATKSLYGIDRKESSVFGTQLLMARRMVESGVRFIQVYHGGFKNNWDNHAGLKDQHTELCAESDQPIAGLLADLKQRNLLDDTLVVWGGEFGRTPTSQDRDGRDHNPHGFTMWMAGGGVKRGFSYGQTDELGYEAVENPVSMHDLHATVLHLLGLDYERLTYRFNGGEQSLVNNEGTVVHDIIA
jgi:hypothetical protein